MEQMFSFAFAQMFLFLTRSLWSQRIVFYVAPVMELCMYSSCFGQMKLACYLKKRAQHFRQIRNFLPKEARPVRPGLLNRQHVMTKSNIQRHWYVWQDSLILKSRNLRINLCDDDNVKTGLNIHFISNSFFGIELQCMTLATKLLQICI